MKTRIIWSDGEVEEVAYTFVFELHQMLADKANGRTWKPHYGPAASGR